MSQLYAVLKRLRPSTTVSATPKARKRALVCGTGFEFSPDVRLCFAYSHEVMTNSFAPRNHVVPLGAISVVE